MKDAEKVRLSKFISLVLRHKPEAIGVQMDEEGWVAVSDLLQGMQQQGAKIDRALLEEIVTTNNKQRFRFSEDGTRIRANQGHTRQVELGYEPVQPPEVLYHGTATRNLSSIREQGLHRGKRFYVHLSEDTETARDVGRRYGKPVVLTVKAGEMHRQGLPFYHAAERLWLTHEVPVAFIDFPEE